jgi:Zn-dependent peptidase ImmA (M78 family)
MDSSRFEPRVLKWAREKRFGPKFETLVLQWAESWDQMTPDLVQQWEAGAGEPSFSQIKKLAEIYKRPLAVFFLDSPPDEPQSPPDLRTVGSQDNISLSPDILLVIRKARRTQEIAAELSRELGEAPTFKYGKHSIEGNPADLAEHIRVDLLISINDQFKFRKYEEFFEYLRSKIESAGAITLKSGLQDSFPVADCRAFSFADQLPYLILINNKDVEAAKNFSLAHELGHLLLREPGICNNFKTFGLGRTINPVEVFCNQFAASLLVPKQQLLSHAALRGRTALLQPDVELLADRLALDFKVSRFVILRRFLTLGLISAPLYSTQAQAWNDEEFTPRAKGGGGFSLTTALKKNGFAFSSLVLEAYRKNKISFAGASDYLGLKTKHLPNFETIVNSHAAG